MRILILLLSRGKDDEIKAIGIKAVILNVLWAWKTVVAIF